MEDRLAKVAKLEAQESKRVAQLEMERAQATLGLRTIHSPIAGIGVDRYMYAGELVRQGPILKLAQLDPSLVGVSVPIAWLGRLTPGTSAEVRVAGSAQAYPATLSMISPVVKTASGTFDVRVELPNAQHRIPAGIPCRVRFPSK